MNLFTWLLAGHLVGDFVLQTGWMAAHKTRSLFVLAVHSLVYTLCIFLFSLPAGGISLQAAAIVFITHVFLDQRGFVRLWSEKINGAGKLPWLMVVLDQSFHLLVLAFIAGCRV